MRIDNRQRDGCEVNSNANTKHGQMKTEILNAEDDKLSIMDVVGFLNNKKSKAVLIN